MSDLSKLNDRQLQAQITATEKQYNSKKNSKNAKDKILASKLKKRLDEMKKVQAGNKGVQPQATASDKKKTVVQKKNNNIPAKKYNCKFKATDKVLVVSVDDLDNIKEMPPLINYLKTSNIPVTLFPHIKANKRNLEEMKALPNMRQGWHGERRNKLDAKPKQLAGTDTTVIAWSNGRDDEGIMEKLGPNTVARGVKPYGSVDFGEFDQHELPSVSLGDGESPNLIPRRDQVLNNGGVLSIHLHHAGNIVEIEADKKGKRVKKGKKGENIKVHIGVFELEETVNEFIANGGRILHLEDLKGCGK